MAMTSRSRSNSSTHLAADKSPMAMRRQRRSRRSSAYLLAQKATEETAEFDNGWEDLSSQVLHDPLANELKRRRSHTVVGVVPEDRKAGAASPRWQPRGSSRSNIRPRGATEPAPLLRKIKEDEQKATRLGRRRIQTVEEALGFSSKGAAAPQINRRAEQSVLQHHYILHGILMEVDPAEAEPRKRSTIGNARRESNTERKMHSVSSFSELVKEYGMENMGKGATIADKTGLMRQSFDVASHIQKAGEEHLKKKKNPLLQRRVRSAGEICTLGNVFNAVHKRASGEHMMDAGAGARRASVVVVTGEGAAEHAEASGGMGAKLQRGLGLKVPKSNIQTGRQQSIRRRQNDISEIELKVKSSSPTPTLVRQGSIVRPRTARSSLRRSRANTSPMRMKVSEMAANRRGTPSMEVLEEEEDDDDSNARYEDYILDVLMDTDAISVEDTQEAKRIIKDFLNEEGGAGDALSMDPDETEQMLIDTMFDYLDMHNEGRVAEAVVRNHMLNFNDSAFSYEEVNMLFEGSMLDENMCFDRPAFQDMVMRALRGKFRVATTQTGGGGGGKRSTQSDDEGETRRRRGSFKGGMRSAASMKRNRVQSESALSVESIPRRTFSITKEQVIEEDSDLEEQSEKADVGARPKMTKQVSIAEEPDLSSSESDGCLEQSYV